MIVNHQKTISRHTTALELNTPEHAWAKQTHNVGVGDVARTTACGVRRLRVVTFDKEQEGIA